jgi:hypothetical protein
MECFPDECYSGVYSEILGPAKGGEFSYHFTLLLAYQKHMFYAVSSYFPSIEKVKVGL